MVDLTSTQAALRIAALLAAPESRTLDFKRISAKHGRMIETICAFANSEGGLLVIGVGDAKDLKSGAKPQSRLFGIEENPEGFDDFRRHVMSRFAPPIERLHWLRLPCVLHDGKPGHIMLLRVEKSEQVHSVVGDGTWTRMDASNREMNAAEIADLHYRRGVRSAASFTSSRFCVSASREGAGVDVLDTPISLRSAATISPRRTCDGSLMYQRRRGDRGIRDGGPRSSPWCRT